MVQLKDPSQGDVFPRKPVRLDNQTSSLALRRRRPFTFWVLIILTDLVLLSTFFLSYRNGWISLPWSSAHDPPMASTNCPSAASLPYKTGQLKYDFNVAAGSKIPAFQFLQDQRREFDPTNPIDLSQRIHVAGAVFVQKKTKNRGDAPLTVDLDVKLSHGDLAESVHIRKTDDNLHFLTATSIDDLPRNSQPCICVIATISIAESATLDALDLNTITLPITFDEALILHSDSIKVKTVSGRVMSDGVLDSKSIEIETTSASILGSYPLANLLSLKTVSGNIMTDVTPKDSNDNHIGKFIVDTHSGDVRVQTRVEKMPVREFSTTVNGISGTVSGRYILGSSTHFKTSSGAIDIHVYPAGETSRDITLESMSGDISPKIHSNEIKLGIVNALFKSMSGTVEAKVSDKWEGHIEVHSMSGSVHLEGKDVKIIGDGSGTPGLKKIVAEKGDGSKGRIEGSSMSGSVRVNFLAM